MHAIVQKLLSWYDKNSRPLPWRHNPTPYHVWISEIILQQTRMEQGLKYYEKFIVNFPNIIELTKASEEKILKLWQGLGYYSRAHNMHKTAKLIVKENNSRFPESYHKIIKLPGIGPYTAAAIASICYNETIPAIDGNVKRVISRIFAIKSQINKSTTLKEIESISKGLIPNEFAGKYNESIMELGALICTPKKPKCLNCPIQDYCISLKENLVDKIPAKSKQKPKSNRYFNYFHIIYGEYTFIIKRDTKDIWQGLYEFPLIETNKNLSFEEVIAKGIKQFELHPTNKIHHWHEQHILSHQVIHARYINIITQHAPKLQSKKILSENINNYPVSRLTEKYLNYHQNLL